MIIIRWIARAILDICSMLIYGIITLISFIFAILAWLADDKKK